MAKKKVAKKKAAQKPASPSSKAAPSSKRGGGAAARREVERLDREILQLLGKRVEQTVALGPPTKASSAQEVANKVVAKNRGLLSDAAVAAIFREIVSGCRAAQTPERIAYLGPEHTFSHIAAIERFGRSAEFSPVGSIAAVFEEVEQGLAHFGIVPLENSTDGRVTDTLDCFSRSKVSICGELPLRIHHCLIGQGPRSKIQRVESKPQALSQCRNWLAKHLPQAEIVPVASTAGAAQKAAADTSVAAIASIQAAAQYGLEVLAPNIEDNRDNITRFAVISQEPAGRTGSDKTALMLEISHEPGALADVMAVFKRNRLNMTWIESFPIAGSRGTYLFFIEFVGHATELRPRRQSLRSTKKPSN